MQKPNHRMQRQPRALVEICRSFSFRLNIGNYQHVDFFCSQKRECRANEAEAVSAAIYAFCKAQVLREMRAYQEENRELTPEEIRGRKDQLSTQLRRPA
jgi:hypothetical protein